MTDTSFHGFITVTGRGNIAIPAQLRRQYHLDQPGAQLELTVREDGVWEVRPHIAVPSNQSWFWTPQWQAKEREADEDIAAGRVTRHDSVEDFMTHLEKLDAEATAEETHSAGSQ